MRFGVVAVAGLMVAAGAQAQQQSTGASTKQMPRYVLVGPGCPGEFTARQQSSGGSTMWATALEDKDKKEQPPAAGSLGVHVEFQGAKTQARSAELSVSYLPAGLRVMPVAPGADAKSTDETKKKTFELTAEDKARVEGNLMVGRAATIESVHLMSVTFTDGSVWHAANDSTCTIEPNRVVRVDSK
jgi:hypothetical protein